jgi:MFS transporter, NRE family, putaive nickel resistance protein
VPPTQERPTEIAQDTPAAVPAGGGVSTIEGAQPGDRDGWNRPSLDDRRPGIRQLLAAPNLRRRWLAQAWAGAGQTLAQIALPLLVYDLTESAFLLGLVAFIQMSPQVVLAPIAGLLADRLDRRRLMISADSFRLALVVVLPFATEVWQVALLAMLISTGGAIAKPAELAAVPAVAGPTRLVAALSLIQVTSGVIRVVVPAIGAGLVSQIGPRPTFWIQGACYVAALLCFRHLVIPPTATTGRRVRDEPGGVLAAARREMWVGLAAIVRHPIVRGVTAVEGLWQLAGAALVVTAVVYTEETLDLGNLAETAFALMTASMSLGAVSGALVAHRLEGRIGRPKLMAIGYLGPFFLMVALAAPPMPVIYAAWFLFGLADAWAVIAFQAYLAEAIPDELRGRVYAAWGAVVVLTNALFFVLIGWLTPILGAPLTFGLIGAIVGAGGPLLLWLTGALAAMRHHRPVDETV